MNLSCHKILALSLTLLLLLTLNSCQQEKGKQHLIISENLYKLTKSGIRKDLCLTPNNYKISYSCLFDGRMSFENIQFELSLKNQRGILMQRDTLNFQLAKEKGTWIDASPLVHEATAEKALNYTIPFSAIYQLNIRLINESFPLDKKLKPKGILGLSLELSPKL